MIGAIVQGSFIDGSFNQYLYHQINDVNVINRVTKTCMKSAFIHETVVSLPVKERKNFIGSVIGGSSKFAAITPEQINSSKNYFTNDKSVLDGLHQAAVQNGFDHIVRVYGDSPILPSWLIGDAVREYFKRTGEVVTTRDNFPEGFTVDVFPFWMLAEAYTYQDGREDFDIEGFPTFQLSNDTNIDKNLDFQFKNLEQAELFDSILTSMDNGHDIIDILGDIVDINEEDIKE